LRAIVPWLGLAQFRSRRKPSWEREFKVGKINKNKKYKKRIKRFLEFRSRNGQLIKNKYFFYLESVGPAATEDGIRYLKALPFSDWGIFALELTQHERSWCIRAQLHHHQSVTESSTISQMASHLTERQIKIDATRSIKYRQNHEATGELWSGWFFFIISMVKYLMKPNKSFEGDLCSGNIGRGTTRLK
jgi:hypothetical protein